MATVQRYESSQSSPQQAGTRPMQESNDVSRGLYQLAGGAQQYAEGVQQRDRARDIVYVANQSAADRLALNAHLNELEAQAPPDGAGVTDAILKAVDGREQASLTAAPTDQARQFLQQHYAQLRQTVGLQAQGFEAQKRGEHTVRQLSDTVDANAVYLATNPGKFDVIKAETDVTLGTLASSAGMNPAVLEEFKKEAYQTLATSAIAGAMQTNPLGALHALSTGQYDKYFKDPAKKLQLINASLSQYTEMQNLAYTQEQRAIKLAADDAAKRGDDIALSGQMTPAWLHANADVLDPADYRHFAERIGKGPVTSDRELYADLRERSVNEDVTSEATAAFRAGQIAQDDYDRLVSASTGGGPMSIYKQGERYIKQSLAKSAFDASGFAIGAQNTADALDEFNVWVQDNPKATEKETREHYTDIVDRWRSIDMNDSLLRLPLPRYHEGGREDLNVAATLQALEDAAAAGEITPEELEAQATLLNQWDQVQGEAARASDAAKAKPK